MKNQYFGDVNDYRKYGLLRKLVEPGRIRVAVCWMLTPDDAGPDGRKTRYLDQPERWSRYDPDLFVMLWEAAVGLQERNVHSAERVGFIPNAVFYCPTVPDSLPERSGYFHDFWATAKDCGLVFFDPDNGLEVKSMPKGRRGSSKYLYWDELKKTYERGHSVLVYQHFPRAKHGPFMDELAYRMRAETSASLVYSFRTRTVVFFLLPTDSMLAGLEPGIDQVASTWKGEIAVQKHGDIQPPPAKHEDPLENLLERLLTADIVDTIEDGHGRQYVVHRSRNGCRFIQLDGEKILMEQNTKKDSRYARMAQKGRKIGWVIPKSGGKWRLVTVKEKQEMKDDGIPF